MEDFTGKVAFVTGGANGIGRGMAMAFAREGVSVAIADVDLDSANRTCKEIESLGVRAIPVACDVTSEQSFSDAADEATEKLGPVHLLLNNAGAFSVSPFEETARRDWEWLLEINVLGVVNGLKTFLPRMRAHAEPAHIINTASVSGHIPVAGLSIYTASKFAVVGLSECLRLELADSGIGLSILCPGIVRTGLVESSHDLRPERHGGGDVATGPDLRGVMASGSDPEALGDQVVAAVRKGEFYILTHPNMRPGFEARFAEILAAYPE
jgi:NAD(P)-dependent dehydrogenase (short-subunit alcohol dehydrogenase family)